MHTPINTHLAISGQIGVTMVAASAACGITSCATSISTKGMDLGAVRLLLQDTNAPRFVLHLLGWQRDPDPVRRDEQRPSKLP